MQKVQWNAINKKQNELKQAKNEKIIHPPPKCVEYLQLFSHALKRSFGLEFSIKALTKLPELFIVTAQCIDQGPSSVAIDIVELRH